MTERVHYTLTYIDICIILLLVLFIFGVMFCINMRSVKLESNNEKKINKTTAAAAETAQTITFIRINHTEIPNDEYMKKEEGT